MTIEVTAPDIDNGSLGSDVFVNGAECDPEISNGFDREVTTITSGDIYTLTAAVTGEGIVRSSNVAGISCPPDCSHSYVSGQGVILQATAADGWRFDHWEGDCAGTGDCSVTMTTNRSVGAVFVQDGGGNGEPEPSDTVTITRAEYDSGKTELRIEATSTGDGAVLTAHVTATGETIGTLRSNGGGRYRGRFDWPTNPQNVTVRSSLGGVATADVQAK